jgi:hypothetical protein
VLWLLANFDHTQIVRLKTALDEAANKGDGHVAAAEECNFHALAPSEFV